MSSTAGTTVGHRTTTQEPRIRSRRRRGGLVAIALVASLLSLVASSRPAGASTSTEPVVVSGTEPQWQATAVATSAPGSNGANHTCAATAAGGVKCWGNGQRGQLGDGGIDVENSYPVDADLNTSQGTPTVPSTVTAGPVIAVAGTHSCVVVDTPTLTGAVQCWGDNDEGQLGDNTTTDRLSPVYVRKGAGPGATYLTGVTSLAAGGPNDGDALHSGQTCAIAGGKALCWGDGANGRLGTGSNTDQLQPAQVSGITSGATNISMGAQGGCVVHSGTAKCWGAGANGQLGDNTTLNADSDTPVTVKGTSGSGSLTSVSQIARSGDSHACALRTTGAVVCWGNGSAGQLGNNASSDSKFPVQVSSLTSGAASVAVGSNTSCATLTSGEMRCWGENGDSQIGDATTTDRDTPATVKDITGSGSLGRVAQRFGAISSGAKNGCAVITAGSVVCWGSEQAGNLGYGAIADRTVPFYVNGTQLPSSWTAQSIAASQDGSLTWDSEPAPSLQHTCAISAAHEVSCWGYNEAGQVGDGTTITRDAPTTVTLTTSGGANPSAVTDPAGGPYISTGPSSSCVVVDTSTRVGGVQCWGANYDGGLGDGTTAQRTTPIAVTDGEGPGVGGRLSQVTSISTSGERPYIPSNGHVTSCAVADGGVFCWGYGDAGRLGNGANASSSTPQEVLPIGSGATQVAVSLEHACALVGSGVRCWGADAQLGDNASGDQSSPVDVAAVSGGGNLSGATSIAAGEAHTCATTTSGVVCWGFNKHGELGNGTQTFSDRPVLVSGSTSSATAVAAGTNHSCAAIGGGVKCWGGVPHASDPDGDPVTGHLGNGTRTGSLTPVQVVGVNSTGTLGSVATRTSGALSAGADYTCAAQTNGRAVCWGYEGTDEAFGDGRISATSTSDNNPPVAADQTVGNVNAGATKVTNVTITDADRWTNAVLAGAGGDESPSVAVATPTPSGTVTCGAFTPTSATAGTFACTYTASSGAVPGPFSYQYTVTDDHGGSSSGTISGTITNQVPTANGQSVTAPRGVATHVVLTGSDPDASQTLDYEVVTEPTKGTVDCNGAHGEDCTYTAGPGQFGADAFTFRANDGLDDSNAATVTITITNQAPTGDAIAASAPRGVATEVVLTGNDVNSDPITFTVVDQPTKGDVSCSNVGICSYTADPGTGGTDTFTFRVNDGTMDSVAVATATITITNQAPIADARSVDAGKTVPTPVVLSGSDPNSDPVTFTVVDQPSKGTVNCTGPTGSDCTYTSTVNQSGSDSFTYGANDGDLDSDPATVTINLENTPPAANPQSVDAPRGVATPVILSGGDDNGDTTTFTVVDQPTKGVVNCIGATGADCTYTANAGTTGSDSFTFKANDGETDSAPATVSIAITNQDPTANTQTVLANAPTTATPVTLTGNDPNGDSLGYSVLTQPAKGTLSCTGDACTYTATPGRTGSDSFAFTVNDGFGGTSTATVNVTLDATTPGVFIGDADMLEPETDSNRVLGGPMVPVTLSRPSAQPVTVWYWTSDGSAHAQGVGTGDYRTWGTPTQPLSVTIPAGKLQTAIAPPVHSDNLVESTETFQVHVIAVSGGPSYLGEAEGTVRIIDTDTVSNGDPVLNLAGAAQTEGNNGNRVVQFRIHLSRPATAPVKLNYATVNGTAIAGRDYKTATGTVTLNTGETSRTIDVLVYPNTSVEALSRTFSLQMSVVSGPALNIQAITATANLRDED